MQFSGRFLPRADWTCQEECANWRPPPAWHPCSRKYISRLHRPTQRLTEKKMRRESEQSSCGSEARTKWRLQNREKLTVASPRFSLAPCRSRSIWFQRRVRMRELPLASEVTTTDFDGPCAGVSCNQ